MLSAAKRAATPPSTPRTRCCCRCDWQLRRFSWAIVGAARTSPAHPKENPSCQSHQAPQGVLWLHLARLRLRGRFVVAGATAAARGGCLRRDNRDAGGEGGSVYGAACCDAGGRRQRKKSCRPAAVMPAAPALNRAARLERPSLQRWRLSGWRSAASIAFDASLRLPQSSRRGHA